MLKTKPIKQVFGTLFSLSMVAGLLLADVQPATANHDLLHPETKQIWRAGNASVEIVMAGSQLARIKKTTGGIKLLQGQVTIDFLSKFRCGEGLYIRTDLSAKWTPVNEANEVFVTKTSPGYQRRTSSELFQGAKMSTVQNLIGRCTEPGRQTVTIPIKLSTYCSTSESQADEFHPSDLTNNNPLEGTGAVGEAIGQGTVALVDGAMDLPGDFIDSAEDVADEFIDWVSGADEPGMARNTRNLQISLNCISPPNEEISTVVPSKWQLTCPPGMRLIGTPKDRIWTTNPNEQRMCTDKPWVDGGKG